MTWGGSSRGGKLTDFKGDASVALIKEDLGRFAGDKDRMAYFSIGLNPSAKRGYTINQVVEGTISIGLGGE